MPLLHGRHLVCCVGLRPVGIAWLITGQGAAQAVAAFMIRLAISA